MVDQIVVERRRFAVECDCFVDRAVLEPRRTGKVRSCSAEQAQLRIRIEPAVLDPTAEKQVPSLQVKGIGGRIRRQQIADLLLEWVPQGLREKVLVENPARLYGF